MLLLLAIASGSVAARPGEYCESVSHAALPVPTCGRPVVPQPASSRPGRDGLANYMANVKLDRMPNRVRLSSPALLALDVCQG